MRSTVIGFLVSRKVGGWELHPGDQLKNKRFLKAHLGAEVKNEKTPFPSMLQLNMDSTGNKHETFSPQLKESFMS